MVTKGMTVVLVRGGAIPPGTTGKVFWVGETKYGVRVGFKDTAGGCLLDRRCERRGGRPRAGCGSCAYRT